MVSTLEMKGTNVAHTRRVWIGVVLGLFIVDGFLRFGYFYFDDLARNADVAWVEVFLEEMTGAFGTALLFFPAIGFIRRFRLTRPTLVRNVPMLLLGLVVYSMLKTSVLWASRGILFPLVGLGAYDYGAMAYRYPMELFVDVESFLLFIALVHVWLFYKDAKGKEIELERARLEALRSQLRPHFLFNTLNTISAEMYREPQVADRILSRLADLLRYSLSGSAADTVSVDEELRVTKLYAEILHARFSDRLEVAFEVGEGAREAAVPSFLLQPLLENAVKHGIAPRPTGGRVLVRVMKVDGKLNLEVEDDGPGLGRSAAEALKAGVGLSNTAARLEQHYRGDHSLRFLDRDGGGLKVHIEIPYRRAAASAPVTATQ